MKKKIVVADDDFNQRDLYVDLFRGKGYDVIPADDGLEALEISLKESPDLIFTGIIMPRMDGFELIHNLRSNVATARIPVIMFSHLGREDDRQRANQLPKVEFMLKGYDTPGQILAKVQELIDQSETGPVHKNGHSHEDGRTPRTTI